MKTLGQITFCVFAIPTAIALGIAAFVLALASAIIEDVANLIGSVAERLQ